MARTTSLVVIEHPDGVDITTAYEDTLASGTARHCEVRRLGHRSWEVTTYTERPSDGTILEQQTQRFSDCNDADLWASAWAGREVAWTISDLISRANVLARAREQRA